MWFYHVWHNKVPKTPQKVHPIRYSLCLQLYHLNTHVVELTVQGLDGAVLLLAIWFEQGSVEHAAKVP